MASLRRQFLDYAQFLGECGYLYLEGDAAHELFPPRMINNEILEAPAAIKKEAKKPASVRAAPIAPAVSSPDMMQWVTANDAFTPGAPLGEEERRTRLLAGAERAGACRACELGSRRNRVVFGDGSPTARIVFIGEAPGETEDDTGLPFVGAAGQLLNKMLTAIGFRRDEVYICNTLKCRPPGNRDPLPGEKAACEPFLKDQLDILRPQMIVGLGAHAAGYLTGQGGSLGRMRKKWYQYRGIPVMVTYHPSFLLRTPAFKTQAWEDMLMLHAKYSELNPDDARKIWKKGSPEE